MSEAANAFISRWSKASPSERANSQLFLSELCDLLGVPHPDPNRENGYGFEYQVTAQFLVTVQRRSIIAKFELENQGRVFSFPPIVDKDWTEPLQVDVIQRLRP